MAGKLLVLTPWSKLFPQVLCSSCVSAVHDWYSSLEPKVALLEIVNDAVRTEGTTRCELVRPQLPHHNRHRLIQPRQLEHLEAKS
jgi:hypothetical protein